MKLLFSSFAYCLLPLAYCCFSSCSNNNDGGQHETKNLQPETTLPPAPSFNQDSAYAYLKIQVDFGPRVPGTPAHAKCAEYLSAKLKSFGCEVRIQNANITTYDKKKFTLKNIIASYQPELPNRILLLSHWDTRHIADQDTVNKDQPGDGADDGASGVGTLLEIARQFSIAKPKVGVDILLDDLEDYGDQSRSDEDTWCLGTQYWTANPHKPGYVAQYGILLDMVGAKGATFPREGNSREFASYVVKKIWNKAANLGYSNYFIFENGASITDDNYYVITGANIPCVDIINMNPLTGRFGSHHHTHRDNMDIIDKSTLKAVGQTVLEVVWEEQHPL